MQIRIHCHKFKAASVRQLVFNLGIGKVEADMWDKDILHCEASKTLLDEIRALPGVMIVSWRD